MALVKGIVKSVLSVSCGVVCGGVCCLTIFALGTATVRVTVFVSGLVIFFANATTLLLRCCLCSTSTQVLPTLFHRLHALSHCVLRLRLAEYLIAHSCSYSYLATCRLGWIKITTSLQ